MPSQPKTALLVVDHGSRSPAANAALERVAEDVAAAAAGRYSTVLTAHLEIASPTIGDAVDAAVAAGAERIVVCLYFLAPGRHSREDAPRLAAEAAARHPGLRIEIADPLGPDPALATLLLDRAEQAARRFADTNDASAPSRRNQRP